MAQLDVISAGSASVADAGSPRAGTAYRVYVLAVIWVVMLLRFVDIQLVSVLLEAIKHEFAASDTQLGLLTGFAFSVFYGTLGMPIARLADRSNRRNILSIAVALWSLMTVACGMASSFASLFAARIGVGIGEAGGHAPAYSLLSDYFPQNRRATVFAIINCAVPVGVFVGFLVGGYVQARHGWRAAFVSVGAPGVLIALMARLTLREPTRGLSDGTKLPAISPSLRDSVRHLLGLRSYRHFVAATTVFTLGAMGSGVWITSFFVRVHRMSVGDTAGWLAWIYGVGGLVGALFGGYLADRTVRRTSDVRWYARLCGLFALGTLPFTFLVYLWPSPGPALLWQLGTTVLMHMWMGPAYGTIQTLAGVQRRAVAAAINMLAINLFAYGLGPLLVGFLSDRLAAGVGHESLRYSILIVVVSAYAWAAVHFFMASRTLRQDFRAARSATD